MILTDIKIMLGQTKLPVTYYSWPENQAPDLPYLVWYLPSTENFAADDRVYKKIETLNIELYTDNKDFAIEQAVEEVLEAWEIVWDKTEAYLEDEHMYEVLYETQITIDNEVNNG